MSAEPRPVQQEIAVDLQDVRRVYRRDGQKITVLDGVTLQVAAGEFLALMGPSGSGKTTLLNLIAGIDRPSSGQVIVGGTDLARLSEGALARWRSQNVGVIFQFYNLIPVLTALDNVQLPLLLTHLSKKERRERALPALKVVGLADRASHAPRQLSGGQEQRVAIARAIVADPTVLVADEPTGDLDGKSAHEVLDLLVSLNQEFGKTIVMVTRGRRSGPGAVGTCRRGFWRSWSAARPRVSAHEVPPFHPEAPAPQLDPDGEYRPRYGRLHLSLLHAADHPRGGQLGAAQRRRLAAYRAQCRQPLLLPALAALALGLPLDSAGAWWPWPEQRARGHTQLDGFVPNYQFVEFHEARVRGTPEAVYRAVRAVRANEIRTFRTLTWIRSPRLPWRERHESIMDPGQEPILDVATRSGFVWLADEPGHESAVGAVVCCRPTRLSSADQFRGLTQPGFAKAGMNFRIEDLGGGECRVTTETRVFATDPGARRRFGMYWAFIYPGSSLIRYGWLAAIKKRAEADDSRAGTTP